MKLKLVWIVSSKLLFASIVLAQTGGAFTIEKSVISSGGGTSSAGSFAVENTIGQPQAEIARGGTFISYGGFITPDVVPTAATVSFSGRVLMADGRGVRNAIVSVTNAAGSTQTTLTVANGNYYFAAVEAGQTYLCTVMSRRFQFTPQIISVTDNVGGVDFIADQ